MPAYFSNQIQRQAVLHFTLPSGRIDDQKTPHPTPFQMFDQLRANFSQFVELTEAEFAELTAKMKPKTLEKNEFFFAGGRSLQQSDFYQYRLLALFLYRRWNGKNGAVFF
jgi:hypothetical protein